LENEAEDLYAFMLTLPWADYCPFVKRVSFGPQMKPVPRARRSGNTNTQKPPYPQILVDLKEKIQTRYNCRFNSLECHLHQNELAKVNPHFERQPGHIAMVSVGQPRRFTVESVQENTWETLILAPGSLLTFFGRIKHSLPTERHACTLRMSLIFRYVPKWLAKKGKDRTPNQEKVDLAEYEAAQPFLKLGEAEIDESPLFQGVIKKWWSETALCRKMESGGRESRTNGGS
jgi:hypothetical protein